MDANRFCRYVLRTTDVPAARAYYAEVISPELWSSDVEVVQLPERAAALGAPAHWLGQIGRPDVEATAARIVAQGGQQLGPLQRANTGNSSAALRDPLGAVLGVCSEPGALQRTAVAWSVLHTREPERALAFYSSLFGWTTSAREDLGPTLGVMQNFAWDETGEAVGGVLDIAARPQVHPHWLFCFAVPDIEESLSKVRARGGQPWGPLLTSTGDLVAACDDPQGAAFGLHQSARA
jgi:predicted enzyme related to lactoylglutathione lyase